MHLRVIGSLALLLILTSTGCFHFPSPYMPDNWPQTEAAADILKADEEAARLQVIIGYFSLWPNHAALRLVAPEKPVIFWDPGGGYGREAGTPKRIKDIFIEGAPDIPTYLPFRWANGDTLIEIFEWYLSDAEALRLHHVLMAGAQLEPDPEIDFITDTMGFFCAAAISKYLYRFGPPTINTEKTILTPSRLSRDLYQQKPDRVLIFRRSERPQLRVMTRPPPETDSDQMAQDGRRAPDSLPD